MTDDEKKEMLQLMRQVIREEVPSIVREETVDLRADVATLKTDVADLKTDVATLKTDVATLKTDVATLKTDVAGLKTDVATLKTDVTELKDHAVKVDKELRSINENIQFIIDTTSREFREIKVRLDNLDNRVAALDKRFSSLENQMKWATDAILDLRTDLKKHQQDHTKYPTMEQLLVLESRVDYLEAQLSKFVDE